MKLEAGTIFEHPPTFRFEPSISPPRFSTSFDYRNSSFESRNSPDDSRMSPFIENGSVGSSSSRIHIVLSTPSPSAFANGERVDKEINRLNKISETWRKHKEFDESDFIPLRFAEDSSQKVIYTKQSANIVPDSKLFRKRKSASRSRSTSPISNAPCPVHSNRRSISREKERLRQSTPSRFSPRREDNNNRKSRSSQSPVATYHRQYRRSSSYDGNAPAFSDQRSPSPQSDIYRRSHSYSEEQKTHLFRHRSNSPGLNPSIGSAKINPYSYNELYNQKSKSLSSSTEKVSLFRNIFSRSNSQDDSSDTLSVKSSVSLSRDLFKDDNKFSTFPRRRHAKKSRSVLDSHFFDNSDANIENYLPRSSPIKEIKGKQYSTYSNPSAQYISDRGYSVLSPDDSDKMSVSPRKLSDENPLTRMPLATLHEDGCIVGSTDRREKSIDREILDDYYNEQRKLSEAGVRKLSGIDGSVVLTEDTDSFIIGDRVWVGGTKPGKISFIGETQFGPGDWAGVTLDDQIGKNDGSVGGYRYFQCEPGKGVFSRLTRLTRLPLMMSSMSTTGYTDLDFIADGIDYTRSTYSPARKQSPTYESPRRFSPSPTDTNKTSVTDSSRRTPPVSARNGSTTNARRGSSPLSTTSELRIGDSVVITSTSGTRNGTLRFIGKTEFADGLWGGVELDESAGKNDGSVAGRKYGLFAPLVRISKKGRASPSRSSTTPTRTYGKETSRASPSYREAPKYGAGPSSRTYKGTKPFDEDGYY